MVTVVRRQKRRVPGIRHGAFLRSELGSTTLEFAVAMPVVVLLIFGTMVAMLGLLCFGNATYASGIAARYAALHSNGSDAPATNGAITALVVSHLWIGGQSAKVTVVWNSGNLPGSSVTVTTALALPLAIPMTNVHELTLAASANRLITR